MERCMLGIVQREQRDDEWMRKKRKVIEIIQYAKTTSGTHCTQDNWRTNVGVKKEWYNERMMTWGCPKTWKIDDIIQIRRKHVPAQRMELRAETPLEAFILHFSGRATVFNLKIYIQRHRLQFFSLYFATLSYLRLIFRSFWLSTNSLECFLIKLNVTYYK